MMYSMLKSTLQKIPVPMQKEEQTIQFSGNLLVMN